MFGTAHQTGRLDALETFGLSKLGEFTLRGVSPRAAANPDRAKLPPGQIHPDNGRRTLGTTFDVPHNGSTSAINQAFDALRSQGPADDINLNALNEGMIAPLGA